MEEPRGEGAVVGEEEEARRVEIEPADGIDAPRARHQRRHRRPPLGVPERAHHAARLVHDDRAAHARHRDALAVERDAIALGIGARAERAHHDAVHRDPAGQDERLRMAPRGHARGAQDLLQALRQRLSIVAGGGRRLERDRHPLGGHLEPRRREQRGAVAQVTQRR